MDLLEIIILGIIQGITEFLPISSSGHLVIAQNILGIKSPGNTLEVLLHFGTLMSVVYVNFEDIKQKFITMNEKKKQLFIFYIIIAKLKEIQLSIKQALLDERYQIFLKNSLLKISLQKWQVMLQLLYKI